MSEPCEQCKSHVLREIGKSKGNPVNMLSYGCDRYFEKGTYCPRNDLVTFMINEMKKVDILTHLKEGDSL